jgi:hypothetical protein
MKDPYEALEEARAAGTLPEGTLLPSDLIQIFGIHPDDRVKVFILLRKVGLHAENPNGILRRYEPEQVAHYLKILIDEGIGDRRPASIERLSISYKSAPKKANGRGSKVADTDDELADDPVHEDDGASPEVRSNEDAPPSKLPVASDDLARLVTPTEAAEYFNKNIKHASVWIHGLVNRHGLKRRAKRGRTYTYRLGDIKDVLESLRR